MEAQPNPLRVSYPVTPPTESLEAIQRRQAMLTGSEYNLLKAIKKLSHKSGVAFASYDVYGDTLGLSNRQIIRLVKSCHAKGFLSITKRHCKPSLLRLIHDPDVRDAVDDTHVTDYVTSMSPKMSPTGATSSVTSMSPNCIESLVTTPRKRPEPPDPAAGTLFAKRTYFNVFRPLQTGDWDPINLRFAKAFSRDRRFMFIEHEAQERTIAEVKTTAQGVCVHLLIEGNHESTQQVFYRSNQLGGLKVWR